MSNYKLFLEHAVYVE